LKFTSRKNVLLRYTKERNRNLLAEPGEHEFIVVLDNLKPSFNVAKIFRSAEAFGSRAVFLVNIGPFDPAPAKGSFRKVPARFFDDFSHAYAQLISEGYTLFVLEPEAAAPLSGCDLPAKSAFIFGHEEFGFSFDRADFPALQSLSIPQTGKVQSLNVSIAAAIVMYEYRRQRDIVSA